MLWTIIDNLSSVELPQRGKELKAILGTLSDSENVRFFSEAASSYCQIFRPDICYLYCSVFEGEANGGGLTDFCDNLILAGHSFFLRMEENPDNFAVIPDVVPFNDDSGGLANLSFHILSDRHKQSDRQGLSKSDQMIVASTVQKLGGVWRDLESKIGPTPLRANWPYIRENLPRVFERWGR